MRNEPLEPNRQPHGKQWDKLSGVRRREQRHHTTWPAARWITCLLVLLLSVNAHLMIAGCRRVDPPSSTVVPSAPPFEDQLARGRRGEGTRINVAKQVVTDAMLSALTPEDTWLKWVYLDAGMVSDEGIASIAQLSSLTHLRLRNSPISDLGIEHLLNCPSLQVLNLPQCDVTAEGIARLAKLPNLWSLRLGGDRLDANVASSLSQLRGLRSVHLIGVPIDDAGIRLIAALPTLESLYIDDSNVSQAGWEWLFESHPDLHVHVNQQHLDRDPSGHQHPTPK